MTATQLRILLSILLWLLMGGLGLWFQYLRA